ncbi:basic leucine zipper transcriptional factor ATF-like 2 [Pelobates fuscus]|uniref:basic leucine zipper transcriptional factor ATF-like 2 n=1 Tax=Pelobates fuscus TaxID=191477 RepID=UPI002FE44BEF
MEDLSNVDLSENGNKSDVTKLNKRQRNRAAAIKSRKKHTERADVLHQEYEKLEKDNAALRNEIKQLEQEASRLSCILKEHETTCCLDVHDIFLDILQNADPFWSSNIMEPLSPI